MEYYAAWNLAEQQQQAVQDEQDDFYRAWDMAEKQEEMYRSWDVAEEMLSEEQMYRCWELAEKYVKKQNRKQKKMNKEKEKKEKKKKAKDELLIGAVAHESEPLQENEIAEGAPASPPAVPAKEGLEPEMVEIDSSNDPTTVKNAKQEMHEAEVLEGYLYNLSQKMRVKEEEFYEDAPPVYEDAPGVADTPKQNGTGRLGASCKAKARAPSSSSASSSSSSP
jgi:hypothetical protein